MPFSFRRVLPALAAAAIFLNAAPAAHAQPKNALKAFCARCERGLCAARRNIQTVLTRKTLQARRTPPPPWRGDAYEFAALTEYTAFYAREPRIPPFPLPQSPDEIYRGMTLDASGGQLRHIFKKGLEVSKCHYENFRAYNGKTYPDGQKAVFAADSPRRAAYFALDETRFDRHLPVIIHLKKVSDEAFISIPHDVPPSWIRRVSALLTLDGQAVWGEISLNKQGLFVFRPYARP